MADELNTPIGNSELSAWQPVYGITWVQTRNPKFALKLSKRSDSRIVMQGVAGGYLRTFEFIQPLSWARRLIQRYTKSGSVANEAITPQH